MSFKLDGKVSREHFEGRLASPVMCVKGANGSGKTHLLKGLAFILFFATKSFSVRAEDLVYIEPFGESTEPSAFYLEFKIDEDVYRYELEVTPKEVVREALYRTRLRKVTLFERRRNEMTSVVSALSMLKHIKCRKNASIISTADQHQVDGLRAVFQALSNFQFNVSAAGFQDQMMGDVDAVSELLSSNQEALNWVVSFLSICDTGVSAIKIATEQRSDGKGERHYPIFIHESGGSKIEVLPHAESSGTKQIFRYLLAYGHAINTGGILIIDEFDLYLHPLLLPKLLEMFLSDANDTGAQLLFSSHDSDIMDICGRYRTCLVQKEDNASFAYRLDEIPGDILRNDRSISIPYRQGKIGGVPVL